MRSICQNRNCSLNGLSAHAPRRLDLDIRLHFQKILSTNQNIIRHLFTFLLDFLLACPPSCSNNLLPNPSSSKSISNLPAYIVETPLHSASTLAILRYIYLTSADRRNNCYLSYFIVSRAVFLRNSKLWDRGIVRSWIVTLHAWSAEWWIGKK